MEAVIYLSVLGIFVMAGLFAGSLMLWRNLSRNRKTDSRPSKR